eukprot:UN02841
MIGFLKPAIFEMNNRTKPREEYEIGDSLIFTISVQSEITRANYVFEVKEVKQDELMILREVCGDQQRGINTLVAEVKRLQG